MSNSINKGFSRYERNGIILLCVLIIISIVSKKYVVSYYSKKSRPLTSIDKNKLAQLQQQISEAKITYSNNYKTKEYNTKDDSKNYTASNATYAKKDYYNFTIEVNSATAEDFEKLYGIGKVYAARIVTFRDKLGGFYSVNQLKDVWGIEDSTFQKFKKNLTIKPAKIQKLNINTATFEELTANPYFFSTVAKQIIGYRSKVKPFATVDDIKNLYYVRDHPEQFNKMAPYVVIN
jgi:competence protein ComEA